jgi:hypothetical protein
MASEAVTGSVPAGLVHGSQAPKATIVKAVSGNAVPPGGKGATAPAARSTEPVNRSAAATTPVAATQASKQSPQPTTSTHQANPHALVTQLNKYLNDSGRPDQFRVDPASSGQTIQEINPSSGAVIGEYSAAQFPELARSLGVSGVLVDSHA